MRILIDIGHPAHVHFFKNFISAMKKKGHVVYIASKRVQSIIDLLNIYELNYISVGKKPNFLLFKYIYQLYSIMKLLYFTVKYKVDIGLGISMTLPIVSKFTKMKCVGFDDDDMIATPIFAKYVGMSDSILTPDCLSFEERGDNHITYKGFHELAYLHPNRFKPDPAVLKETGIKEGERFYVLRFNEFKAHHDIGAKGLSQEKKRELIQLLKKKGKVFISTEGEIDPEFSEFRLKLSPEKIHSFLYFSYMFIGDSQTMTSEAAVLGTPAIRNNSFVGKISYLEEEEHKYGLTYGFTPDRADEMIRKLDTLSEMPNLKEEWQKRRKRMLADKIDVTAFLVWFVENYPESFNIMKKNPDYQLRFK